MSVTRRQMLGGLAAAAAASVTPRRNWAAERDPIRVGFLAPFTGPFAQNAKDMWDGFRLYFDEINYQAAGRKIEIVSEDSWVEPAGALTKLRKLVEMDRINIGTGGLMAPTSLAIQPYVVSQRLPFIVTTSADDVTQHKTTPWFIRLHWSTSQNTHPLGEYAYKDLGYRRIAGLNFDYLLGYSSFGGFQRVFEELGGRVVQKLWSPPTATDLAPYLTRLKRNVDALFLTFSGNAALQVLRQAQQYGITGKIPIIGHGLLTDEHVLPSMGDEALGVVSALNYSAALDTPANLRFRAAIEKKYGRMASFYFCNCYTVARWMVEGFKAVEGDVENRDRLLAALKQVEIHDDPRGPMRLDAWSNPIQNIYIRKVERVRGQLQNTVIYTYPNVGQFWTYKPEEFLKNPPYDRDAFPGCKYCE